MRKKMLISIAIITILLLNCIAPILKVAAGTDIKVMFEKNMYAAIKGELQRQGITAIYNDAQRTMIINDDELAKVTSLSLSNCGLTNLTGLEIFTNLKEIDLSSNELNKDSNLEVLNSFTLTTLDLSSNEIEDLSMVTNIKEISKLNLHNQKFDVVEIVQVDNSTTSNQYDGVLYPLPKILTDFVDYIPSEWLLEKSYRDNGQELNDRTTPYIEWSKFDHENLKVIYAKKTAVSYIPLKGMVKVSIKVIDSTSTLYNSDINLYFVTAITDTTDPENTIDERGIHIKDTNMYNAIKKQLTKGQTENSKLISYGNGATSRTLYNRSFDDAQTLVISIDDLINKITNLKLDNKRIKDLSGIEKFVGLETNLDLSGNYIKSIDKLYELEENQEKEEALLRERVQKQIALVSETISQIDSVKAEIEAGEKSKQSYIDQNAELAKQMTKLQNELEELNKKKAALEGEAGKIAKLQEEIDLLEDVPKEGEEPKEGSIAYLKKQVELLQGDSYTKEDGTVVKGLKGLNADLAKLKEDITTLNGDIAKLNEEKAALNKTIDEKKQEIANKEKEKEKDDPAAKKALDDAKADLEEAKNRLNILRTEIANKQTEITNKQTEIANKRAEIAKKQAEIDSKRKEISDIQERISNINGSIATYEAEKADINLQIAQKRAELAALLASNSSAEEKMFGSIEWDNFYNGTTGPDRDSQGNPIKIPGAKAILTDLETKVTTLRNEIGTSNTPNTLLEKISTIESEISDIEGDITNIEKEIGDSNNSETLEGELKILQDQLKELQDEKNTLENGDATLEGTIKYYEKQIEEKEAELAKANKENADKIDEEIKELNDAIEETKGTISEKDKAIEGKEKEIKDKEKEITDKNAEIEAKKAEIAEAQKKVEEATKSVADKKAQIAEANKQLEELSKSITTKLEEIQKNADSQNKNYDEIGKIDLKLAELKEKLDKLNKDLLRRMKRLYTIYNRIDRLTAFAAYGIRDLTDQKFYDMSFEESKALFDAQVSKISSIEKSLTSFESSYLISEYGIPTVREIKVNKVVVNPDGSTKTETETKIEPIENPISKWFSELANEEWTLGNYKTWITRFQRDDIYFAMYAYCYMTRLFNGTSTCAANGYVDYIIERLEIDGESTAIYENAKENYADVYASQFITIGAEKAKCEGIVGTECLYNYAKRITLATGEELNAYVFLPRLKVLDISENLIEDIDNISRLTKLVKLYAGDNEIVDISKVDWASMNERLRVLDLSLNDISNIEPLEVLTNIVYLDLSKNLIEGEFTFKVEKLDKLKHLDLSYNRIDDIQRLINYLAYEARANGYNGDIGAYLRTGALAVNFKYQQLEMTVDGVLPVGDTAKVELPKFFRQIEQIDYANTSFAIDSIRGNVTSDGKEVILDTRTAGKHSAIVSIINTKTVASFGYGTTCTISYRVGTANMLEVTVTPNDATVVKGTTQQFKAEVTGDNVPYTGVTWSISGNTSADTKISETGLLTVAENEESEKIEVIATSFYDTNSVGKVEVVIANKAEEPVTPENPEDKKDPETPEQPVTPENPEDKKDPETPADSNNTEDKNEPVASVEFGYTVDVDSDYLVGIKAQTSVDNFKSVLLNNNDDYKVVVKSSNKEVTNGNIATGMFAQVQDKNGNVVKDSNGNLLVYEIVVKGDVNGDGIADSLDTISIKAHRSEVRLLNGAALKAADINNDNSVDSTDSKLLLYHRAEVSGYNLNYTK